MVNDNHVFQFSDYNNLVVGFVHYMAVHFLQMTSVERILIYSDLEQEPAPTNEYRPSDTWPEAGSIQFQNVSLHYYEGAPAALQNISVNIHPKEKVNIKHDLVHKAFIVLTTVIHFRRYVNSMFVPLDRYYWTDGEREELIVTVIDEADRADRQHLHRWSGYNKDWNSGPQR